MTQQQLADAANVDIKTIGSLETRGRWPIARTRARIEKALGWSPGEMGRIADDEPPPEPRIPKSLLSEIMNTNGLTPEERQAVIEAVERTLAKERGESGEQAAAASETGDAGPERRYRPAS